MEQNNNIFDIAGYPVIFDTPERIVEPLSWVQHIPFAFFIVELLKPRLFVELGTHSGNSYNSVCQAVKLLRLNTRCFAVDNWKGDLHAGFYDETVFNELKEYQDIHYQDFSTLLKMSFDDGLNYFEDKTIDLLHIDGLHTYESVKHDFEGWLPKMSEKGVIIFHDTMVRENKFGVWKLMDELKTQFAHIEFKHGNGLCLLFIGMKVDPGFMEFVTNCQSNNFIYKLFENIGKNIWLEQQHLQQKKILEHQNATLRKNSEIMDLKDSANLILQQTLIQKEQQLIHIKDQLKVINQMFAEKLTKINHWNQEYWLQPNSIEELNPAVKESEKDNAAGQQPFVSGENEITDYQNLLNNLLVTIESQSREIHHLQTLVSQSNSITWKLTSFVRFLKRLVKNNYFFLLKNVRLIEKSGLFNAEFYLQNYPDVALSKISPARHYLVFGGFEGRNPSQFFDSSLYLANNQDVKNCGMNPLVHYLRFGINEKRDLGFKNKIINVAKSNSIFARKNKLLREFRKLKNHFFSTGIIAQISNSEYFDKQYYLKSYFDVKQRGIDPARHYLFHGWKEGRDPSLLFDNQFYLSEYPDVRSQDINPLLHYIKYGKAEGRKTQRTNFTNDNQKNKSKLTTDYENEDKSPIDTSLLPVKLIAFYLPQFHPIPENDEWWGKGFTEWTNVTRAKPYFEGHNQPNLPTDLGFYDLRVPEVMEQQIYMAKSFGIQAFCFHYYWFAGKRLLEKPLDMFLGHKEWNFNFCICWANENWTRRWDGFDHEILIAHKHSPAEDIAFLDDASRYLLDSRYLRIDKKPLLIVYRPQQFENMNETAEQWRLHFKQKHNTELFIAMAQTFGKYDPREYGLDAAIEFPPNNITPKRLNDNYKTTGFAGNIYSALTFIENKNNKIKNTPYQLFRCLMLNWDNTPRKGIFGNIFLNNTPENYGKWLTEAIKDTLENKQSDDEMLLFINAWNEWAEGTHLEPNQKYGYAYLNMTKKVLNRFSNNEYLWPRNGKIVFFSHDASLGGSQLVLLKIVQWLKTCTSIECKVVFLTDGELSKTFADYAEVLILDIDENKSNLRDRLSGFINDDVNLIYLNSVASGKVIETLRNFNIPIITHFHELKESVSYYAGDFYKKVLKNTDHFIACSQAVKDFLVSSGAVVDKISLIYAFIQKEPFVSLADEEKIKLKKSLGLPYDKKIIIAVGLGLFWRKGADLFIDVCDAYSKLSTKNDYLFLWVGGDFSADTHNNKYHSWNDQLQRIEDLNLTNKIKFTGTVSNVQDYLKVSEVFLLTSREDPFPLVCLEAANHYLPIICFEGAGGMPEFVRDDAGFVIPFGDSAKMATVTLNLLHDEKERIVIGNQAFKRFVENHTVPATMPKILNTIRIIGKINPLVSIIVPNHNYARYLDNRLTSIYNQTFQDFEVIILDDASTDNSFEIIEKYRTKPNTRVFENQINSGSVMHQWQKGVKNANGTYIWIAEADDYCEWNFLERTLKKFADPSVFITYCNSNSVDEHGIISENFYVNCGYYEGLGYPASKWKQDYLNIGTEEIKNALAIKNTIPNCSAVVFKKAEFLNIDFTVFDSVSCGHDWLLYVNMLMKGSVAYVSEALNYHRRHPFSVISKANKNAQQTISEYHYIHNWIFSHQTITEDTRLLVKRFVNDSLLLNWNSPDLNKFIESFPLYFDKSQND